jgi:hypothetical protein
MLRLSDVINATLLMKRQKDNYEFAGFSLAVGKNELLLIGKDGKAFKKIGECKNPKIARGIEKEDSAEFFLLNEGSGTAEKISFYYPLGGKGGIRVDKSTEKIGFELNGGFDADANDDVLFIADQKSGQYALLKWNDSACAGKIKCDGKLIAKSLGEDTCLVIGEK